MAKTSALKPTSNRGSSPLSSVRYVGFVDPSGGSNDSMTMCVAHREGAKVIVDCIGERRAPFSPDSVVTEFAATFKTYKISRIVGDRYAGEWPREAFRKQGVTYDVAEMNRSELYLAFLPVLNSGRLDLLDNPRMVNQFVSLERRVARSGSDSPRIALSPSLRTRPYNSGCRRAPCGSPARGTPACRARRP